MNLVELLQIASSEEKVV